MDKKFECGDIVYLVDGAKAEYVMPGLEGHIVRVLLRDKDYFDDSLVGPLSGVDKVFSAPPVEEYAAEIVALQKQKTELLSSIKEKRQEIQRQDADIAKRKAAFSKHRALDRLEDFIEGRITHVILVQYGKLYIKTLKDALRREENYDRSLKLVTLFGDSKGDLQWHLDHYSDGSGASRHFIFPFLSEQDAIDSAVKMCDVAISQWRNNEKADTAYWKANVSLVSAVKFLKYKNLSIPEDVVEYLRKGEIEMAQQHREHCAKSLAEAEEKLAKAMEG